MSGKGMTPIKGYNLSRYRDNYPFPERKTSTQWCADLNLFPMGPLPEGRMTETEFRSELVKVGHMHKVKEPETPNHD